MIQTAVFPLSGRGTAGTRKGIHLHWERGVLTAGLPGKPRHPFLKWGWGGCSLNISLHLFTIQNQTKQEKILEDGGKAEKETGSLPELMYKETATASS